MESLETSVWRDLKWFLTGETVSLMRNMNNFFFRHVSHYLITYYLPSGLFVIVSWIRREFLS